MQRMILALVIILALAALALPASVFGTANTVTCTVSAEGQVGVEVYDGSVDYGALPHCAIKNTAMWDATYNPYGMNTTQTQTIYNIGNVNENFEIKTSQAVGATNWSLLDPAGFNVFTHKYNVGATMYNATGPIPFTIFANYNYVLVATNITPLDARYLELQIGMPTATSDAGNHTITETNRATQS